MACPMRRFPRCDLTDRPAELLIRRAGRVDVLSDVLRAVRLTGAIFFDVKPRAPWVAATPAGTASAGQVMPDAEHVIMFHAVASRRMLGRTGRTFVAAPYDWPPATSCLSARATRTCCAPRPGRRAAPNLDLYYRPTDRATAVPPQRARR